MARTAADDPRLVFTFPVELPANTSAEEVEQWLSASGYTRVQAQRVVGEGTRRHQRKEDHGHEDRMPGHSAG